MSFAITSVWVRGRFQTVAGTPVSGAVVFTPTPPTLVHTDEKLTLSTVSFVAELDADGAFAIQLPATDDARLSPSGWTYRVVEPDRRAYYITVPAATAPLNAPGDPLDGQPVVELSANLPAAPSAGAVQLLPGVGIESMAIDANEHLIVTLTDGTVQDAGLLPSGAGGTVPDATTTTKGKTRLMGGTADAPTVPWGSVTGVPDLATQAELDAGLAGRAPSVHGHTSSAISDFTEAVQDTVAALLGAGSNITLAYDDAAGSLTVTAVGDGTGLDAEAVRDAIGVALVGVAPVSVAVNDAADTITISTTATVNATDAQLRDRDTHTGEQPITSVTGLQAALDGKAATTAIPDSPDDIGAQPAGDYAAGSHQHGPVVRTVAYAAAVPVTGTAGLAVDRVGITATGDLALTPAGTLGGQLLRVDVLASGAQRTVTLDAGVRLSTGLTSRSFTVPAGQIVALGLERSALLGAWVLVAATVTT